MSLGFMVKYFYVLKKNLTQKLYYKSKVLSIKTSFWYRLHNSRKWFGEITKPVCGGDGFNWAIFYLF